MTTLTQAWDAISPTPVEKGTLIEPEATDRNAPRPWLHLPPGALAMMMAFSVATAAATVQTGLSDVRRDGLPAMLPEGLPQALPRFVPAPVSRVLEAPLAPNDTAPKRHRTRGKLHRAIRDQKSTEWSRAG